MTFFLGEIWGESPLVGADVNGLIILRGGMRADSQRLLLSMRGYGFFEVTSKAAWTCFSNSTMAGTCLSPGRSAAKDCNAPR